MRPNPRWRVSRFAIVLLACWVACVTGAAAEAKRAPADYEKVDTFVNEPLDLGETKSVAELRKTGSLIHEQVVVVNNRHEPTQKDEIRTLLFDGLVIEAYYPARDNSHGIVTKIVVTKPAWKLRHGLKVGATETEIEAVLGEPDEHGSGRLKYCGDMACGTFFLRDGRVIKVVFEGSVD